MSNEEITIEEWPSAIGKFITGFAYIEMLIYQIYGQLPNDEVSRHGRSHRNYSDRARLLQALIRSTAWNQKKHIEEIIEKTYKLATLRNQIAHNPMLLDIWINESSGNLQTIPVIHNAKKGNNFDHISLAQLSNQQSELSNLSHELASLLAELKMKKPSNNYS